MPMFQSLRRIPLLSLAALTGLGWLASASAAVPSAAPAPAQPQLVAPGETLPGFTVADMTGNKKRQQKRARAAGQSCTISAARQADGTVQVSYQMPPAFSAGTVFLGNDALFDTTSSDGAQPVPGPSDPGRYTYYLVAKGASGHGVCRTTLDSGGKTSSIFDLTPGTLAPAPTTKQIVFVTTSTDDAGIKPRTVHICLLRYRQAGGKVSASWDVLPDGDATQQFMTLPAWRVVNHHGTIQICNPAQNYTTIATGPDSLKLTVNAPKGGLIHEITISPEGYRMRVRETGQAIEYFGVPYFFHNQKTRADKLALKDVGAYQFFDRPYERISIGDYSKLTVSLDLVPMKLGFVAPNAAKPEDFVDRGRSKDKEVCVTGKPSKNANLGTDCIGRQQVGNMFSLANFNLQWRDDRCRNQKDQSFAFCRFWGNSFYFTMKIADSRYDFIDQLPNFTKLLNDPETGKWIYRLSLQEMLGSGAKGNPFKIEGKRTTLKGDILKPMRDAVLQMEKQNAQSCSTTGPKCFVPPRLTDAKGNPESDDAYLSHFTIGNAQLGYEMTTLGDMDFLIKGFSLTGQR